MNIKTLGIDKFHFLDTLERFKLLSKKEERYANELTATQNTEEPIYKA